VVHSNGHGEPKATIRPGDHGSVTGVSATARNSACGGRSGAACCG